MFRFRKCTRAFDNRTSKDDDDDDDDDYVVDGPCMTEEGEIVISASSRLLMFGWRFVITVE